MNGLRCARCCQPLAADLADREALADYGIACGPACLRRPARTPLLHRFIAAVAFVGGLVLWTWFFVVVLGAVMPW